MYYHTCQFVKVSSQIYMPSPLEVMGLVSKSVISCLTFTQNTILKKITFHLYHYEVIILNIIYELVTFILHIWSSKVQILARDRLSLVLLCLSSVSLGKCWDKTPNQAMTTSFHNFSSSFTYHPTVQCYTAGLCNLK